MATKVKFHQTTSTEIKTILRNWHEGSEWAFFTEIPCGTGGNSGRTADAFAMNMWTSRGLATHGYEIKISRGDWLRELADPSKSEPIQRYCDYWWIAAPKGMIQAHELPPTWGLCEVSESGKLYKTVPAPRLEAIPLDRAFVASILRSQAKLDDQEIQAKVSKIVDPLRKQYQEEAERNWRNRRGEDENLKQELEKIQEATGISILSWGRSLDSGLLEAIKFAQRSGLSSDYSALSRAREAMANAVKQLNEVYGLPSDSVR